MTRKEIIRKIPGKNAEAVMAALTKLKSEAGPHFGTVFKSITADNGLEFAELSRPIPLTSIYFTHPYASQVNAGQMNGIIRCFIPKGKRMSDYWKYLAVIAELKYL